MEQVVYTFLDKKEFTKCFVTIKGDFMFSSIVTTNIQKTLESTILGLNTHISSANIT